MEDIVEILISWFRETARDLPWRKSYDPYQVWISEIMLQQTQMERGVSYFLRWVSRFPSVADVASADEDEILKYWEGLGYYARARNLHRAAKQIVDRFQGIVPDDYDLLRSLPGIGPYTAAAIASVAGNHDIPVVDANVLRVFSRLYDIAEPVKTAPVRKKIEQIAAQLLPKGKARLYNQALMDFGGLLCMPRNPQCPQCPVSQYCQSYTKGTVAQRPVLAPPKRNVQLVRVAVIVEHQGKIFIQQRAKDAVWGGLWEFPGGEFIGTAEQLCSSNEAELVAAQVLEDCRLSVDPTTVEPLTVVNHQYTHHRIALYCYRCRLRGGASGSEADNVLAEGGRWPMPRLITATTSLWLLPEDLAGYGFPAGPRKLLEWLRAVKPEILHSNRS